MTIRPAAAEKPSTARAARATGACRAAAPLLMAALLASPGADAGAQALDAGLGPDPAGEALLDGRARIEVRADVSSCFVMQVVELRLRIELDAEFLETQALPLFRRAMDLPVQIDAPWWDAPPGTLALDAAGAGDTDAAGRADDGAGAGHLTLALGDAVVPALRLPDEAVDGRRVTVVELRRRVLPRFPGPLTLPAPTLHFAYATAFRDDLVQGRVPLDRHAGQATGEPLVLDVRPLPEAGRPAGFGGAVGRFTIEAEVEPDAPRVGEQCVLTLRIAGNGNLSAFDAPRLPPLDGLRVLGRLSDEAGPPRTIRYALVPERASVDGVGPVRCGTWSDSRPA